MGTAKKPSSSSPSPEDFAFEEAYQAARDGDKDGFVAAIKAGVRACMDSYEAEESESEEDE